MLANATPFLIRRKGDGRINSCQVSISFITCTQVFGTAGGDGFKTNAPGDRPCCDFASTLALGYARLTTGNTSRTRRANSFISPSLLPSCPCNCSHVSRSGSPSVVIWTLTMHKDLVQANYSTALQCRVGQVARHVLLGDRESVDLIGLLLTSPLT